MGQQQLLLIVMSVILVGIAVTVGITMFQTQAEQSNIDALIADLYNLGYIAAQYRIRPGSMGGGNGSYNGFDEYFDQISADMKNNTTGVYSCEEEYISEDGSYVSIRGISTRYEDIEKWILVSPKGEMVVYDPEEGESEGWGGGGPPPWAGSDELPPWSNGKPPWVGG